MDNENVEKHSNPLDFSLILNACEKKQSVEASAAGIEKLRDALRSGASPNKMNRRGRTPLAYACEIGALCAARELLAYGAPMSASSPAEMAPLIQACFRGHDDVARLLLESGALVNEPVSVVAGSQTGLTALHAAAAGGRRACAEALLRAGADPRAKIAWNEMTPSEVAKHNGNDDLADFIDAFVLALDESECLKALPAARQEQQATKIRL